MGHQGHAICARHSSPWVRTTRTGRCARVGSATSRAAEVLLWQPVHCRAPGHATGQHRGRGANHLSHPICAGMESPQRRWRRGVGPRCITCFNSRLWLGRQLWQWCARRALPGELGQSWTLHAAELGSALTGSSTVSPKREL